MSRTEAPDDRLSVAEVENQFHNFSEPDWKRALSLARMCAAGLTGWSGEMLLAEAMTKLLSGERIWRRGVHPLVTLKTVMRSISSNTRKREENGPIDPYATVDVGAGESDDDDVPPDVLTKDNSTPEAIVDNRSQLSYIETLVADDEDAGMVLMAWAEGLRGKEAAEELGFEMKRYEAARKRLMKRLEPVAAMRKTA